MELLSDVIFWFGVIVTAATSIVATLEKVAAITPTTKDDEYVGRVKKYLSYLSAIADYVSVWNVKK